MEDNDEGFSGGVLVAALAALLFFACVVAIVAYGFTVTHMGAHNAPAPARVRVGDQTPNR